MPAWSGRLVVIAKAQPSGVVLIGFLIDLHYASHKTLPTAVFPTAKIVLPAEPTLTGCYRLASPFLVRVQWYRCHKSQSLQYKDNTPPEVIDRR